MTRTPLRSPRPDLVRARTGRPDHVSVPAGRHLRRRDLGLGGRMCTEVVDTGSRVSHPRGMTPRAATASGPGVLDALSLLAQVADEVVLRTARDTHLACADRVHRLTRRTTGGASTLPELVHL